MVRARLLVIPFLAVALMALWPGTAQASYLGQVSSARVLERGVQDVGGFVGLFDDAMLFFGQARRGLSSGLDGGLQFGVIDPDNGGRGGSDVGIALGGDLKFSLMSAGPGNPLDLSLAGKTAFFSFEHGSAFQIGCSGIVSQEFLLSSGSSLVPYAAVNLRIERVSSESADKNKEDTHDTSLEIGAMGGVKWDVSHLIDILGELVIDDDIGFIFGLNFKI